MKKVSVIMPLYNAEKYMTEAIEGILHQTYVDFELLCIDDCSTDNTKKILTDFAKRDERIRILTNRKRFGAGPSRNRGLEEAKGKFVIFLDGDDVFSEELLETTCRAMEQCGADVALFDAAKHVASRDIHIEIAKEYPQEFEEKFCKKPFCIHDFSAGRFPLWSDSIGDKMFRRSFVLENRLEFQNLPSSNDVYFVRMALYCAEKVIWAQNRKILLYTREHSEPSRISNDRDPMCAYYAWEKLAEELAAREMLQDLQDHYFITFAAVLLNRIRSEKNKARQQSFYLFLQNEGIAKCLRHESVDYGKIDHYAVHILDSIQKNAYESGWFTTVDTCFQFYIKRNGEKVCRFIEEKLLCNQKIVLWGVGTNGTTLLEYLTESAIRISGIVDCDEKKQGMVVCGYEISKPDLWYQEADYILVISQEMYWDVSNKTRNTGIKLVDLLALLTEGDG